MLRTQPGMYKSPTNVNRVWSFFYHSRLSHYTQLSKLQYMEARTAKNGDGVGNKIPLNFVS